MRLLLIALAVTAGLFVVQLGMHANGRHGTDAEWVRQCLRSNGTLEFWHIPGTDKGYRLCTDLHGKYGLQAVIKSAQGEWVEVTSFVKNKFSRLRQIEQYLKNVGATRLW